MRSVVYTALRFERIFWKKMAETLKNASAPGKRVPHVPHVYLSARVKTAFEKPDEFTSKNGNTSDPLNLLLFKHFTLMKELGLSPDQDGFLKTEPYLALVKEEKAEGERIRAAKEAAKAKAAVVANGGVANGGVAKAVVVANGGGAKVENASKNVLTASAQPFTLPSAMNIANLESLVQHLLIQNEWMMNQMVIMVEEMNSSRQREIALISSVDELRVKLGTASLASLTSLDEEDDEDDLDDIHNHYNQFKSSLVEKTVEVPLASAGGSVTVVGAIPDAVSGVQAPLSNASKKTVEVPLASAGGSDTVEGENPVVGGGAQAPIPPAKKFERSYGFIKSKAPTKDASDEGSKVAALQTPPPPQAKISESNEKMMVCEDLGGGLGRVIFDEEHNRPNVAALKNKIVTPFGGNGFAATLSPGADCFGRVKVVVNGETLSPIASVVVSAGDGATKPPPLPPTTTRPAPPPTTTRPAPPAPPAPRPVVTPRKVAF